MRIVKRHVGVEVVEIFSIPHSQYPQLWNGCLNSHDPRDGIPEEDVAYEVCNSGIAPGTLYIGKNGNYIIIGTMFVKVK